MVDNDSMGPSLQLVRAQFSNFLLRKLSHEFKPQRNVDITQTSNGHISLLLEDRVTWLGCW